MAPMMCGGWAGWRPADDQLKQLLAHPDAVAYRASQIPGHPGVDFIPIEYDTKPVNPQVYSVKGTVDGQKYFFVFKCSVGSPMDFQLNPDKT